MSIFLLDVVYFPYVHYFAAGRQDAVFFFHFFPAVSVSVRSPSPPTPTSSWETKHTTVLVVSTRSSPSSFPSP